MKVVGDLVESPLTEPACAEEEVLEKLRMVVIYQQSSQAG